MATFLTSRMCGQVPRRPRTQSMRCSLSTAGPAEPWLGHSPAEGQWWGAVLKCSAVGASGRAMSMALLPSLSQRPPGAQGCCVWAFLCPVDLGPGVRWFGFRSCPVWDLCDLRGNLATSRSCWEGPWGWAEGVGSTSTGAVARCLCFAFYLGPQITA